MTIRSNAMFAALLLSALFLVLPPAASQGFIAVQPFLAGGTSDPVSVQSGAGFAYTMYGFDKDTFTGGAQFFYTTVYNSAHEINSMPPGEHTITLQGMTRMPESARGQSLGTPSP